MVRCSVSTASWPSCIARQGLAAIPGRYDRFLGCNPGTALPYPATLRYKFSRSPSCGCVFEGLAEPTSTLLLRWLLVDFFPTGDPKHLADPVSRECRGEGASCGGREECVILMGRPFESLRGTGSFRFASRGAESGLFGAAGRSCFRTMCLPSAAIRTRRWPPSAVRPSARAAVQPQPLRDLGCDLARSKAQRPKGAAAAAARRGCLQRLDGRAGACQLLSP